MTFFENIGLYLLTDRISRLPRIWSNKQIRQQVRFFKGDIANISGWDDRDKEGSYYKDYFTKAKSYTITNYTGDRGFVGIDNELCLDLTQDLPKKLLNRFDVCFNHTTLEHIFDIRKAFSNICKMSRDIVIVIVPFAQAEHETESFKDFWRFTPSCLRYLFKENGLEVVYEAQSPYKNASVYLLFIGSKYPYKWVDILPHFDPIQRTGSWLGYSLIAKISAILKRKIAVLFKESC